MIQMIELRSIDGSDDEVDYHETFNPDVDFRRNIELKRGLKFKDIDVLRKAVHRHSIENHYCYYLLHSQARVLTAYCRFRCDCPWDSKHGYIVHCTCKGDYKCKFRIYARRMKGGSELQIKTYRLYHECGFQDVSSAVTFKYLAERYLDHWRIDPDEEVFTSL